MVQKVLNLQAEITQFYEKTGAVYWSVWFCVDTVFRTHNRYAELSIGYSCTVTIDYGFYYDFYVLYGSASWCRYICPLGLMNGIYSKLSIIESQG
jgi:polyferredoxin